MNFLTYNYIDKDGITHNYIYKYGIIYNYIYKDGINKENFISRTIQISDYQHKKIKEYEDKIIEELSIISEEEQLRARITISNILKSIPLELFPISSNIEVSYVFNNNTNRIEILEIIDDFESLYSDNNE